MRAPTCARRSPGARWWRGRPAGRATGRLDAAASSPRRRRRWPAAAALAVVFGPEASGLRNDELALCHVRVHIPTDPAQPSLNLAQAVLLVAYELRLAALPGGAARTTPAPRAPAGEVEEALDDLRDALLAIGYLNPESPERHPVRAARAARSAPRSRRARSSLLRGMARQIRWAGDQIARARTGNDNRGAGEARGMSGAT